MEEKQLDFSQPILSVRRASSSPVVVKDYNRKPANVAKHPVYKPDQPEVKLGQVRVSGTVPFIWERRPGTPKNESSSAEPNSPAVPRLPPGRRRLNAKSIASEGSLSSPAKAEERSTYDDSEEEEEVRFVDAHDKLSRTESNGLDNTRPNRTLSSDLRGREFMMGKLLPAAEAMASETTRSQQHSLRYPTKKQPVLKEQARQFKAFSNKGDIFAYYGNNPVVVDDDDHSEPDESSSLRLCGLLPLCGIGKQSSSYESKHSMDSFRMRCCPEMINVSGLSANKGWTHNHNGSKSPQVPFARKGEGFLGIPERYNRNLETVGSILRVKEDDISSFGELLLSSESSTPAVEKILYMDPVHDQDKKGLTTTEEDDSFKHEKFRSFGACYLSFSDDDEEGQVDMNQSGEEKHYNHGSSACHPLSLPLPKSPSESWLKKALPTVPPSKSPLGVVVFSKSSPDVWKTIVKASDGKNMHFEFSEGNLKPIPEA